MRMGFYDDNYCNISRRMHYLNVKKLIWTITRMFKISVETSIIIGWNLGHKLMLSQPEEVNVYAENRMIVFEALNTMVELIKCLL